MSDDDTFPSDRANRIADAVEDIEQNVTRLRELQDLTRAEYKAPNEQDRRDAVERKFEKLTEAVLDIATEILKQEQGTAPERRKQTVTALEEVSHASIRSGARGFPNPRTNPCQRLRQRTDGDCRRADPRE